MYGEHRGGTAILLKVLAAFGEAPSGVATDEADWEEKEDNRELGFDQTVKKIG
jgi:hypothetical protein